MNFFMLYIRDVTHPRRINRPLKNYFVMDGIVLSKYLEQRPFIQIGFYFLSCYFIFVYDNSFSNGLVQCLITLFVQCQKVTFDLPVTEIAFQ